jgi:transcriptional regulator with GAF, ATPase, and Fis domain
MDMPKQLAAEFAALARELATQPSLDATLAAIVKSAVDSVEGAESAAITVKHKEGKYATIAATDDLPRRVDALQYDAEEGPCVDTIGHTRSLRTDDVGADPRWPVFGPQAAQQTEVVSMLSHRLYVEDENTIGALNLYSRQRAAFSTLSEATLDVLATHVTVALENATNREEVGNLRKALDTSRTIGMAMGILMKTHTVTSDDAFALLRIASQHQHRKLAEIALEVVDTGELDVRRT